MSIDNRYIRFKIFFGKGRLVMTLFGMIWLLLAMICFGMSNIEYLAALTLLSSVFQCNNIVIIGGRGVGPQIITSLIFIVRVLMYFKNSKIVRLNKSKIELQCPLILFFFIVLHTSIENDILSTNYLYVCQLLIYILCYCAMFKAGEFVSDNFVYSVLRKTTIFLSVVGFLQILITSNIIPRFLFVQTFFYNDTLSNAIYYTRDNYFRVLSTYMEPSYYAGFLVGAFYYFLILKEKRKENIWLLSIIMIQILLTFSSTAYGAFLVTGIVLFAFSKEGKLRIFILCAGLLGMAIMYFGFYDVLNSVIFSKMSSGSGVARQSWNTRAIANFNEAPIWGVGYKMSRASSLIYTLLSEVGLMGTSIYGIWLLGNMKPLVALKHKDVDVERNALRFSLVAVVACQMIAVPDLDICVFWMWLNYFALCVGNRIKKIRENLQ